MSTKLTYILIPAALLMIAFTFGLTPVQDFDIWWHIHLGQLILKDPSSLWHDAFSYTAYGRLYHNHSWLGSVILYLLYSWRGINSAPVLALAVTGGITFIVYRTLSVRFEKRWGLNLFLTFITIWMISDRVDARPYIWSTLFISIYFYIISHPKRDEKNALWYLIPLQFLWANLHGGAILGIAMAWIVFLACRKKRELYVALGATAVSFITPYSYNTLLFPLMHSKFYYITHYTSEWLSPFSPQLKDALSVNFFLILLFLLPASFILSWILWRRFSLERFLLSLLVTYMACTAHRFIVEFILVSVPVIAINIGEFKMKREFAQTQAFNLLIVVVIITICSNFLSHGVIKTLNAGERVFVGTGVIPYYAPKDALDFLNSNNIKGKMFNDMAVGGYLSFFRPDEKIFIDGRSPLYGDEFFGRYAFAMLYPPVEFERFEKEYGFDYIVLLNYNALGVGDFHAYLWSRKDFALVYCSPTTSIYVKRVPKFEDVIKKYRILKNPVIEQMKALGMAPKLKSIR